MLEPCDVLITAAFAPELVGFAPLLGPTMRQTVAGLVVAALPVGIGLVSSAGGATAVLAGSHPRAVVLVGTCGAYPGSRLAVGDVIVARSLLLVEPAALAGEAAFPEPLSVRIESHAALTTALAVGRRVEDVATTLAVTTSDVLADRLARGTGAAVEHLEAFAVATACAVEHVPFAVVLGVANAVGAEGRGQWRANHEAVGRAAASLVEEWLSRGGAGVPARVE